MEQTTELTSYEKQGIDFLNATNTEMTVKFLRHGKHFDDDKEDRDIYEITLKRGNRSFTFNFGQSINRSGRILLNYGPRLLRYQNKKELEKDKGYRELKNSFENQNFSVPNAYDVLTCLTKYDPGTFENFCSEFGYDTDSRKAEKTYKAVVNEWQNIAMLFTDAEIEQLQEIQ